MRILVTGGCGYIVSNAKIEPTGWRPDHRLAAGVRELVKGYRTLRNGRFSNV
jgi:nucleoside-diphosphate-sugar epimerase